MVLISLVASLVVLFLGLFTPIIRVEINTNIWSESDKVVSWSSKELPNTFVLFFSRGLTLNDRQWQWHHIQLTHIGTPTIVAFAVPYIGSTQLKLLDFIPTHTPWLPINNTRVKYKNNYSIIFYKIKNLNTFKISSWIRDTFCPE